MRTRKSQLKALVKVEDESTQAKPSRLVSGFGKSQTRPNTMEEMGSQYANGLIHPNPSSIFNQLRSNQASAKQSFNRHLPFDKAGSPNNDSWLKLMCSFTSERSPNRELSFLYQNGSFLKNKCEVKVEENHSITPFEDSFMPMVKVEEEVENEMQNLGHNNEIFLQKRKRGRPLGRKSNPSSRKKDEGTLPDVYSENTFMPGEAIGLNYYNFDSESSLVSLDLKKEDLDIDASEIRFGQSATVQELLPKSRGAKPFSLDLGQLIGSIEKQIKKKNEKTIICQFCGKCFNKPSALGGHTAKMHAGMSLKYKRRVVTARHRQIERLRTRYITDAAFVII